MKLFTGFIILTTFGLSQAIKCYDCWRCVDSFNKTGKHIWGYCDGNNCLKVIEKKTQQVMKTCNPIKWLNIPGISRQDMFNVPSNLNIPDGNGCLQTGEITLCYCNDDFCNSSSKPSIAMGILLVACYLVHSLQQG